MAPIDRREHRQQRVRGAGPSSVQASFGFNFGALGAQSAKQSSLPPPRSARRTPVQSTPRGANGSARRHRSASAPRSSNSKRKSTPRNRTVTPQLGKRKRGSTYAQAGTNDGEEDELSPDREEVVRSIEKSRRVVGTVSPIREELDDVADELSIMEEGGSTARKSVLDASAVLSATPVSVLAKKRILSGGGPRRTPIADRVGSMSATSRGPISRRSKSADAGPVTPGILPNGQSRPASASRFGSEFNASSVAQAEESEDELSPPQINGATPRVVTKERNSQSDAQNENEMDVDELSSPMQPTPNREAPTTPHVLNGQKPAKEQESVTITRPAKRGRPRRVVLDEEDEPVASAQPIKSAHRGRPQKPVVAEKPDIQATPAARKPGKRKGKDALLEEEAAEELDELSPETEPVQRPKKFARHEKEIIEVSDAEGNSDEYEEPELEEEEPNSTPRPIARRPSPKKVQHVETSLEKPPRKRQKFSGPKHAISVMRIKGSTVRGITVADTTRTILEETIDHRLNRIAEKMQTSSDSAQRKDLRSEINLSLSFKESLNEKLLDLQDANDVLSINFKKMKLFKRDNAELRKEILSLQNSRQEIALEHDDVQAEFEAEKAKVEARNTLSANMFDIEAAIHNGRERARKEGREDEGPEIPISMLLETVGRDVGSSGGGLLGHVRGFNGLLERAAGWLEGRA
ncbi:Nn.00g037170.m01.CDS01 [Neocucurbitaria sp. VM-36]